MNQISLDPIFIPAGEISGISRDLLRGEINPIELRHTIEVFPFNTVYDFLRMAAYTMLTEGRTEEAPSYFEYKYGINFTEEQAFLQKNGYLSQEMKLTDKGNEAISLHYDIITNHK